MGGRRRRQLLVVDALEKRVASSGGRGHRDPPRACEAAAAHAARSDVACEGEALRGRACFWLTMVVESGLRVFDGLRRRDWGAVAAGPALFDGCHT